MLLVCLDDGRLSGGAPLSQNILSAENQKLTDTGGKFPHGEGALALDQILNTVWNTRSSYAHPARVSRRSGPLVLLRSALAQMISARLCPVTAYKPAELFYTMVYRSPARWAARKDGYGL